MSKTRTGSLAGSLALAAAAFLVGGCNKSGESADANTAAGADETAQVKCLGVNECKGQGACGGPGGNACAGQNECKGKGWIKLSQAECAERGGTVLN